MPILRAVLENSPLLVMGALMAIFFDVPIGWVVIAIIASFVIAVVLSLIICAVLGIDPEIDL